MTIAKKSVTTMAVMLISMVALLGVMCLGAPTQAHAASMKANSWKTVYLGKHGSATLTYKMPAKGYVNVIVKGQSSVTDWGEGDIQYNGTMYTSVKVKKGKKVLDELFQIGVGKTKKLCAVSYKKGTKITIKLKNSLSSNDVVKVKVALTKKKNMETESNDSKKKADAIKLGKGKAMLAVAGPKDWDFYKFTAPKKGTYKVQVRCTKSPFKKTYLEYESAEKLIEYKKGWKTVDTVELEKDAAKIFKIGAGTCDGMVYQVRVLAA